MKAECYLKGHTCRETGGGGLLRFFFLKQCRKLRHTYDCLKGDAATVVKKKVCVPNGTYLTFFG